ncbi:MAG: cell division protein FtsL [Pseudomonadota bacterium]
MRGLIDPAPLGALFAPFRTASGWQVLALAILVLLSSLGAVWASHESRRHFEALERARLARDHLLEQRGRLLIERGAFSAYHRVDVIATEQLVMRTPGVDDTILVRP